MEDVLTVYQQPYDPQRPQVCVDEIQKTLRSTPYGMLPLAPRQPQRVDYEYERHGHCALFLAVEPLAGFRKVWVQERRTLRDFAEVLRDLADVVYPNAQVIVLVTDNLNIHDPACLYERFAPAEARRLAQRFEWHYTPEHASWLNVAECELSVLKRQCLQGRLPDIATVRHKVTAWQADRNQRQTTIDWRFTTEDARIKLKRLYPVVKVQDST